ncbi:PRC-barrel domain-containing protein [Rhodoplanes sp. SY1]|uniref:PRC-barrel domain-containing protein n=1 Tax=Rhodoplanes sp. SY1 TaxID=3166646 RepID=UPI0038B67382
MRRVLLTTTAMLALAGVALAQSAAPSSQQPSAAPAPADKPGSGATAAQPRSSTPGAQGGLRSVDPGAQVRLTFYTVQAADMRASKLLGTEVYNLNNENIGDVEDLIIDNGKTIKGVVVSVGGFLGIGERNVALDPRSVVLSEQSDGSARLVVNTTKEDLKSAPPFNFADVDRPGGRSQTTGSSSSGAALQPNPDRAPTKDGQNAGGASR